MEQLQQRLDCLEQRLSCFMGSSAMAQSILQELQAINKRLSRLEQQLPSGGKTWLTSNEMGKICGLSGRTLLNYIHSGKLSAACFKRKQRGKHFSFLYHRELVMCELGLKDP
jgi:hypothetical protein